MARVVGAVVVGRVVEQVVLSVFDWVVEVVVAAEGPFDSFLYARSHACAGIVEQ